VATLILLGNGWGITRTLADKEIMMYMVVVLLYGVFEILRIQCISAKDVLLPNLLVVLDPKSVGWGNEDFDQSCESYQLATYILRSILLLGVIVALNFNITNLRSLIIESVWRAELAVYYHFLKRFSDFRWIFLAFLLSPTLMLIAQVSFYLLFESSGFE